MSGVRWQRVLGQAVLGAAAFWLPDVLWHIVRGNEFDRYDVLGLTIVMPLTLLAVYLFLGRNSRACERIFPGWPLMLGVWEMGGAFMMLGWSFSTPDLRRHTDSLTSQRL